MGKKFWYILLVVLLIAAVVCEFITSRDEKKQAEELAAQSAVEEQVPEDDYRKLEEGIERTEEENNLNSLIDVEETFKNSGTTDAEGNAIPDIMSEAVIKSNYRKVVLNEGTPDEYTTYMTGPRIAINGHVLPDHAFFAQYDVLDDSCQYVLCSACFKNCGFEANSPEVLTEYDKAVDFASHTFMVNVDELELHSTWTIEKYDKETNTYYFKVEQNGPFSGTSDVFGVFVKGERMNTMPSKEDCLYTTYVDYKPNNSYWDAFPYQKNQLRVELNRLFGLHYRYLPAEENQE